MTDAGAAEELSLEDRLQTAPKYGRNAVWLLLQAMEGEEASGKRSCSSQSAKSSWPCTPPPHLNRVVLQGQTLPGRCRRVALPTRPPAVQPGLPVQGQQLSSLKPRPSSKVCLCALLGHATGMKRHCAAAMHLLRQTPCMQLHAIMSCCTCKWTIRHDDALQPGLVADTSATQAMCHETMNGPVRVHRRLAGSSFLEKLLGIYNLLEVQFRHLHVNQNDAQCHAHCCSCLLLFCSG